LKPTPLTGYKPLFAFDVISNDQTMGFVEAYYAPSDPLGVQIHLEIEELYRKKWLSRSLRDELNQTLMEKSRLYGIERVYSVAFLPVSAKLLVFFGFKEFAQDISPKTYYYKEVN